ncbi:MAG TPA: right-handed parallel beta-helix repeat-containing protein [Candidatus Limnocylindrales bacterium]|nr:right-handed parallel beta-helix repeat-containing protein [Candidatus Limnocylindrales bacterium]
MRWNDPKPLVSSLVARVRGPHLLAAAAAGLVVTAAFVGSSVGFGGSPTAQHEAQGVAVVAGARTTVEGAIVPTNTTSPSFLPFGLLPSPSPLATATPAPAVTKTPTVSKPRTGSRPAPRPVSKPTSKPKVVAGIHVPSSINSSGSADASSALNAFIRSVPNGSTIVFKAHGVYRMNHGIVLDSRHNLVFEGNGATLRSYGSGSVVTDSLFDLRSGDSGITVRDFTLLGDNPTAGTSSAYHGGAENQIGVTMYGARGVNINHVTISSTYSDCVYVGMTNSGVWSDGVTFTSSTCERAGRSGISIVAGTHVTVSGVRFTGLAMHVLNIEPDYSSGGGTYVMFRSNSVGTYSLSRQYSGYFFAADGAPGSKVNNITVTGNHVSGNRAGYDGIVCGLNTTVEVSRRSHIVETNNTASLTASGPVLLFNHVDGLTVTGNHEALSHGSLVRVQDSTSVHVQ